MDTRSAWLEFDDLGLDAIPVTPRAKAPPLRTGYAKLAPGVQWVGAPEDCNIAIRGGGPIEFAAIDCDEKKQAGTFANVTRILGGWGYYGDGAYPVVQTASGVGRWVGIRITEPMPAHRMYALLRPSVGAGELRFGSSAYVVAPPSEVGGREYKLLAGSFKQLPALDLRDLRELVDLDAMKGGWEAPTPAPGIPRRARRILRGDTKTIGEYKTRSDAEQACIASLIGAGHNFDSVAALFRSNPGTGKFGELRRESETNAIRWLRVSYDHAKGWSQRSESPGRALAHAALLWALSAAWPGRTGGSDRAVFLAHATIARKAGALAYHAGERQLAELAGCAKLTANKATHRLCDTGLVEVVKPAAGDLARVYRLAETEKFANVTTSTQCGGVEVAHLANFPDAFRRKGLGRSAFQVWETLRVRGPMVAARIAEATGRSAGTVSEALRAMSCIVNERTGEVHRLVQKQGKTWVALEADFTGIAQALGVNGIGNRQARRHARERAEYRHNIQQYRQQSREAREAVGDD